MALFVQGRDTPRLVSSILTQNTYHVNQFSVLFKNVGIGIQKYN